MVFYTVLFLLLSLLLLVIASAFLVLAARKKKWKYALWGMAVPVAGWTVMFLLAALLVELTDIRLKRPVSEEEVVGSWLLRKQGIETATNDRYDPYQPEPGRVYGIEFRADGTCSFRSIVQRPAMYMDCEGTWELTHEADDENVPELRIVLNQKTSFYAFTLGFTEQKKRLVLYKYWGDPDHSDFLEYDKRAPGALEAANSE